MRLTVQVSYGEYWSGWNNATPHSAGNKRLNATQSRKYRASSRTHERRSLAELALTHVHDVRAAFFENDPKVVNTDQEYHRICQSDCVIDLCDGPHLLEVNLVRTWGLKLSLVSAGDIWN